MKRVSTSILTLACLLITAAVVVVAGLVLSQREVVQREVVDRAALQTLVRQLHAELTRLDGLYEQHLEEIARTVGLQPQEESARLCQGLEGVKYFSILRGTKPEDAVHVEVSPVPAEPFGSIEPKEVKPSPLLRPELPEAMQLLPLDRIFSSDGVALSRGWQTSAKNNHTVFWVKKSNRLVVTFVVDAPTVQLATQAHIQRWLQPHTGSFLFRRDQIRIDAPWTGGVAGSPEAPTDTFADFSAPLASLWGFWQVQAWDRTTTRETHAPGPLAASVGLATFILLTGLLLFRAQHRAHRLASQQVSFVNRVSHELGTPLTNMLLNLDLARDTLKTDPTGATKRITLAEQETQRLVRLTRNILTFSRSTRHNLEPSPHPVVPDELVTQVVSQHSSALERQGLQLHTQLQAGREILLAADAFEQILGNLLCNVEKYAATGGWAEITTQWEDGWLTLLVADRGPGIAPRDRERVFLPFERVGNSTSEGVSGTGLGLSISRDLAHSMGGDLTLVPSQEVGCIFALSVPAPATSAATDSVNNSLPPTAHEHHLPFPAHR